ncbi:MAG: DUF58 domain-containing protein [Candidatus Thermoplasmatota archaeon]|nr:DUF58 domain-containing protein [Candidatus Thermoplasmatota archaeon]
MIKKSGYLFLGIAVVATYEGLLLGFTYFILFASILFFTVSSEIIIFNMVTTSGLRSLEVRRFVDNTSIRKGEKLPIKLKFTNVSRRRIAFHYYDTLSDVFTISGPSEGYVSLAPGEERNVTYVLASLAVGKYIVGPVIVYSEDPMKLCLSMYKLERQIEVKVAPALTEIRAARTELLSNIRYSMGVHKSRVIGQGYNFYGIRPYDISDEFRYIAWTRYGIRDGDDLYVKQMEEEKVLNVYFVIDYSISSNFGFKGKRMYDRMVISAINSAYSVIKNRDDVGFYLLSTEIDLFIEATHSDASISKLETSVSELRPSGHFDIMSALDRIRKKIKRNALIVVLSPMSEIDDFKAPKGSLFQVGKKLVLVVLSPSEFAEKRDWDQNYTLLLKSALVSRQLQIKQFSRTMNSIGLKTILAEDSTLQRKIINEYQYAKMVN